MPLSSSSMRPNSAARETYGRPAVSRSSRSSLTWRSWPPRTAKVCCASSTATPHPARQVQHETTLPGSCFDHEGGGGDCRWRVSGSRRSGPLFEGASETVLCPALLRSRTHTLGWASLHRAALLHTQSVVEVQLVPARLRLRHRVVRPR